MPAATWGWLRMNQTKLELSDELAVAPAEAVEVEGLDEQFRGAADAFDTAMDAMQSASPSACLAPPAMLPTARASRPRTELDVPAASVYQGRRHQARRGALPGRSLRVRHGRAGHRIPGRTMPPSASLSRRPPTDAPRLPCA